MNCLLIFTLITANPSADNNTMPRAMLVGRFNTESECIMDGKSRKSGDFQNWVKFSDEQGNKQVKSECVCFNK